MLLTSPGRFESTAREILAASPETPRYVSLTSVLRGVGPDALVVVSLFLGGVFTGVGATAFGIGALVPSAKAEPLSMALMLCMALFGLLVLSVPLWRARRIQRALVRGELCRARVISAGYIGPNNKTLDALENGLVQGTLAVADPRGESSVEFEIDAPWARDVKPGRTLEVLVDRTRKPLLVVGLARD